jgi:hypothetical protein
VLRGLSAGVLVLLTILVILVIAAVPLIVVYRSTCPSPNGTATQYSVVPPWSEPPEGCTDHQQGFDILVDALPF